MGMESSTDDSKLDYGCNVLIKVNFFTNNLELRPLKRLFYYSQVRGLRNDMLKLDFFLLNFVRLNLNHSNNTLFKRQVLNKDLNYKFKYCPIKIKVLKRTC